MRLFSLFFFDKLKTDGHDPTSLHSILKFFKTTFFDFSITDISIGFEIILEKFFYHKAQFLLTLN